ncbi:ABC-type multidrug transport system, ATPase and permease component [Asanoa hainanensis]|uniref:ABC-type multidrug transport system, ATPase and permease component n=1 Tax=Asanoa hainanensis TaxID=560556 RepID=A0A239PBR1_9ACTN|nr:ABC transporter ATP-binding protein [Asanoa hainanensis]SNT64372.1 ABC-type multidrug transport system, ATPase and permease component [Asanoa hainanensis]
MPPQIPHAQPGVPDIRGPFRYIWWLIRSQPWRVLRGGFFGTVWMVGLAVRPYLISKAVDDGLRAGHRGMLLLWVGAIVLSGLMLAWLGIMRHRTMTFVREDASARSAEVVLRHLARTGSALSRRLDAGEVATVSGRDIQNVSHVLTFCGPGIGAVVAYAAVAVVLWTIAPTLAVLVLVGVPGVVAVIAPLVRRLERVETDYRRRQGALTARAADIVAGLRVLAGVGGRGLFAERYDRQSRKLRAEGYRVAAVNSWIEGLAIAVPAFFAAIVVWVAAHLAATGQITVGEMIAVYGYCSILAIPCWMLLSSAHDVIRGRVAARRIIALLAVSPDEHGAVTAAAPAGPADLHDPDSGLTVPAGRLVAVAADDPGTGAALADRLARYATGEVTWGGVPLRGVPLPDVRRRILIGDHDSYLFAGPLRGTLDRGTPADVTAGVHAAAAEDVVDALPAGLDTDVDTQGRTLSGGQRQRVRLARAMLADAEVLILVDPTSAVDAHTEARIASRLRAARAGRTTVLVATSPLLLGQADEVAFLRGGRVTATGSHADLLASDPAYRALVASDVDAEVAG